MMLKAGREIGDLETEVLCLKQLITHSRDPTKLFDELIQLQKSVQNDIEGNLDTCLSKYVICRDEHSRITPLQEILFTNDYANFNPQLTWMRSMVLRALAHSKYEANLCHNQARNLQYLSPGIRDFMKHNFPETGIRPQEAPLLIAKNRTKKDPNTVGSS